MPKIFKRHTKISIILLIILTIIGIKSFSFINNSLNSKPILKYKILNGCWNNNIDNFYIFNVLNEKFKTKPVDKNYDLVIDSVFGDEKIQESDSIKIFFTGEAIKPKLKNYDLSIGFDYINHPNYLRIPLYFIHYGHKIRMNYDRGQCNPKAKKNFACFLVSNGGGEARFDGCVARNRLFYKLSLYKNVLSGGKHLNNINEVVPFDKTIEWLSNCKFIISYENQSYAGYITEKPFQSYFAGAIPLYKAHPSVLSDINSKAIIFADDFKSEDELVEYIKRVDNDDELYCKIWNEQIITKPEQTYKIFEEKFRFKFNKILEDKGYKN